jgi:hypothetical protein
VSIGAFAELRRIIEAGGGKVKYRSVAPGAIPADTFEKACAEIRIDPSEFKELFNRKEDEFVLTNTGLNRDELISALSGIAGKSAGDTGFIVVADFLADWVISGRAPYELCCTSRAAFDPAGPDGGALTPVEEAHRLVLAQVFVLTLGQSVPAIYFNDLLGLGNDTAGYGRTGQPRDLNRHKSPIDEIKHALAKDEFTRTYVPLLNSVIKARTEDPAFYPLSRGYEFVSLTDTVFINHAFTDSHHSLIIGNIEKKEKRISVDLNALREVSGFSEMTDRLTGETYRCRGNAIDLELPAFGAIWLSA